MKYLKNIKIKQIKENLNNESEKDLEELIDSLQFAQRYLKQDDNLNLYELIDIVKKILSMRWDDIILHRDHLLTNYTQSSKDNFTIELINRYCSN